MKIMIAGGGTGGHIYPGLAIAAALKAESPHIQITFVGSLGSMEESLVPQHGYSIELLPSSKFVGVGLLQKVKALVQIPLAIFYSIALMIKYRPHFVLGVGGFASGVFVLVASFWTRTALWEANAIAGRTNRWLSRFVRTSYIVFDRCRSQLSSSRVLLLGLPVRSELERIGDHSRPSQSVFIFGGSQGSRAINLVVIEMLQKYQEQFKGWAFVHQIGKTDWEKFKNYADGFKSLKVEVVEFVYNMSERYQNADIVVSRAGAGTVVEIAATQSRAILIPLPTAADNHQFANAESLSSVGAATLISQSDLTAELLRDHLLQICREEDPAREQIKHRLRTFYRPKAAHAIAQDILAQIEQK